MCLTSYIFHSNVGLQFVEFIGKWNLAVKLSGYEKEELLQANWVDEPKSFACVLNRYASHITSIILGDFGRMQRRL